MKLIRLIITIIAVSLTVLGCEEIPPQDNITSEFLYETPEGAIAGLAGVYSRINSTYRTAVFNAMYPSASTDEANYARFGFRAYVKNNFTPSDIELLAAWAELYRGLKAANIYIKRIQNSVGLSEDNKKELLAEGYFVRGYILLDIQRAFGWEAGVPMPLAENTTIDELSTGKLLLPRTPGIEVYKQAISDFEKAEMDLPHDSNAIAGRPGKSAARGLIARCYLYLSGEPFNEPGAYNKVKEWTKKIIDDGFHMLNPSYRNIFDNLAEEKYERKEMLFQIGYSYAELNNQQASQLGSTFGFLVDDEKCFKSFEINHANIGLTLKYREDPSDERGLWNTSPFVIRRKTDCKKEANKSQWHYTPSKYRRELEGNPESTSWGAHHWPVLRYADILLMYAEAENKINPGSNEALTIVNQIRDRAKATPLTSIDENLIQEERRLELCFEGLRKYDLARWGILELRVLETKELMDQLAARTDFYNLDWEIYGGPNLGPDGIPLSGDEPAVKQRLKNGMNSRFDNFDGYNDFEIEKHYILPIPEQEVSNNPNIKQSQGW